jgi:hypothetical protein
MGVEHAATRAAEVVERRIIGSSLELRELIPDEDKDGKPLPVLQGYAARFNMRSLPLGRWAFAKKSTRKRLTNRSRKIPTSALRWVLGSSGTLGRARPNVPLLPDTQTCPTCNNQENTEHRLNGCA